MSKGILAVVSGFSGSGKGTLMNRLMEDYDNYALSVSATTRTPREGEVDGREYFFISREEFETMIDQDALVEYAQYVDNYYGTPKAYVQEQLDRGRDVILEIEIQGAHKIKTKFPEAVLIFVTPPNAQELKNRLEGRGTETPEKIKSRLRRANEEAEGMSGYDYIVINDKLEECVCQMHNIIQSEHYKSRRNQEFIGRIQQELKVFMKGE